MKTFLLLIVVFIFSCVYAFAEMTEKEKIEKLIIAVENAPAGTIFIRNGIAHSADNAASHLRTKYRFAGGDIKTAKDFITHLASRSSQTGEEYLITLPDNSTVKAKDYFEELLKKINAL